MAEQKSKRPFFGRKSELAYLRARAEARGLTAIVGRPQAGKSWLLEEFRDQLAADDGFQVGYAESTGQYADLLLRSLSNLYKSWLSNASYMKQAASLWKRHKKDLIAKAGGTIGSTLGKFLESQNPAAKGVGRVIDDWFKSLRKVDTDLREGGVFLPVLSYDQARDLLLVLDVLSEGKTRAVLILDAFDRGTGAQVEAGTLRTFLQRSEDWPECHIFVVTRSPDAKDSDQEKNALRCCQEFASASVAANLWEIPDWGVGIDDDEARALWFFLNDRVPATKHVANERLMKMIGDVPGVIGAWLKAESIPSLVPQNEADLKRLAAEAHANSHHEIKPLLFDLLEKQPVWFKAVIRVALLPEMTSQDAYNSYIPVLEAGLGDFPLAQLQGMGLLEQDSNLGGHPTIPTFGHITRYQAVRNLTCENKRIKAFAREEARLLILELATRLIGVSPDQMNFALALRGFGPAGHGLDLQDEILGLCHSAATLFEETTKLARSDLIMKATALTGQHPGVAALVGLGLFHKHAHARNEGELASRDTLVDELRRLANTQLKNVEVQLTIAVSLTLAMIDADIENNPSRRDALNGELRKMGTVHPEEPAIKEALATGLFLALLEARANNDQSRSDRLKVELRTYCNRHPNSTLTQGFLDYLKTLDNRSIPPGV